MNMISEESKKAGTDLEIGDPVATAFRSDVIALVDSYAEKEARLSYAAAAGVLFITAHELADKALNP